MGIPANIIVPWHSEGQIAKFQEAWGVDFGDIRFVFQRDTKREGCAKTKNAGITQALRNGAEVAIVLDDDCYPSEEIAMAPDKVDYFIERHLTALEPVEVEMFQQVTTPPSRGTPYFERTVRMPVAASMGFWTGIGDYDAPHQLAFGGAHPMVFSTAPIYGRYFPLCGMNLAFRPAQWSPWCRFVDIPRFDDIWQGFLWQKKAYAEGYCFNLEGPMVQHSRQSDVWANLRDETLNLQRNETLWKKIFMSKTLDYDTLLKEVCNE